MTFHTNIHHTFAQDLWRLWTLSTNDFLTQRYQFFFNSGHFYNATLKKASVVFIFESLNFRGSAIAKIVGANAKRLENFEDRVTMYVYEEIVEGKKLTEIINETHENVKYLPGHVLPDNVVSFISPDSRARRKKNETPSQKTFHSKIESRTQKRITQCFRLNVLPKIIQKDFSLSNVLHILFSLFTTKFILLIFKVSFTRSYLCRRTIKNLQVPRSK